MDVYELDLGAINHVINVEIIYKDVKGVRLKVYSDCFVKLSVPLHASDEWITDFLEKKKKWVDIQISKYKEASGVNTLDAINNGTSVRFLGKDMRVVVNFGTGDNVSIDGKEIIVCTNDTSKQHINHIFSVWWRENAIKIYKQEESKLFNRIFNKYRINEPIIFVREMKTLWGSCTPSKCKITLNTYLLKANIRCVQYVILHELTHLLYPNHSKNFYDFLTIQMPDWNERKKELDKEVVQSLS